MDVIGPVVRAIQRWEVVVAGLGIVLWFVPGEWYASLFQRLSDKLDEWDSE